MQLKDVPCSNILQFYSYIELLITAKAVAEDRAQSSRHILCVGYRDTDFVKYFLFIILDKAWSY